jgi:hypothetical protein
MSSQALVTTIIGLAGDACLPAARSSMLCVALLVVAPRPSSAAHAAALPTQTDAITVG